MLPVSDPRLVMVVLVNEPRSGERGGGVAAPIFGRVAERGVRYGRSGDMQEPIIAERGATELVSAAGAGCDVS